jgi:ABC-type Zn uptake system ZnuABC Zn-binding protein ZnuA
MKLSGPLPALALLATVVVLAAGCGGDESGDGEGLEIAATTGIGADIVRHLTGDVAEVTQIVPDGSSPHSYAPSAKEQAEIDDADLVVQFSPSLEQALPLEGARNIFSFDDHVRSVRDFAEQEVGAAEAGEEDPHVWMDPTEIASALPALAAELGRLDPPHRADYERNARRYDAQLHELDATLRREANGVPPANRELVTSHDVLGYFADRYGYEVIGTAFGPSPEAELGASTFGDLVDTVETSGVPAVFAGEGDDPAVLDRVADETGVTVVDDLQLESLSDEAPTYTDLLQQAGAKISAALGG